jgi:hypothetical protein
VKAVHGIIALALLGSVGVASAQNANKVVLITAQEAGLPSQPNGQLTRRGITRGPQVSVLSPKPTDNLASPVHLQLKFESHGGATIDPSSLKVTYMREPAVDLTDRVKAFASATGLDITAAEIPPGDHVLRVDVKDSDGRVATTLVEVKVNR